jgi:hypothetical protein
VTLDDVVAVFRRHLYLPDLGPVEVVLATAVANLLPGDPVWLLVVGPPSSGKTELLAPLSRLPYVHEVSTFTEAGLLTRRGPGAGGLLAELGSSGMIVCKDFTSLLSESADTRSGLLAALREIYDGKWVRRLGVDGGRSLVWQGKAGLLAAVTETIDRHTAVIGAMGERFVLYRMPALDDEGRLAQGRTAFRNAGRQEAMRAELADAVGAFLTGLVLPSRPEPLSEGGVEALVLLADLAARCRSVVERDPRDREVELVPQPEAVGRLQAALAQLTQGLLAIGADDVEIGRLITQVALDGMPKGRRAIVELLAGCPGVLFTAAQVAEAVGLPTGATARALEDLAAHAVVERRVDSTGPDRWWASTWLHDRWSALALPTEAPN